MKVRIKSRAEIEALASEHPFPFKSALISIADYGDDFAELKYKPDFILQLSFDDVDGEVFVDELGRKPTEDERRAIEEKYHMLNDKQAEQIADFYHEIKDKANIIICQCEYGMSRSAAVAAAILEYSSHNGIAVFADDRYCPNKNIFKKVFKAIAR